MDTCPMCGHPFKREKGSDFSEVIDELVYTFHFGFTRAASLYERWGYTLDDIEAWRQHLRSHDRRLTSHLIQLSKRPEDITGNQDLSSVLKEINEARQRPGEDQEGVSQGPLP